MSQPQNGALFRDSGRAVDPVWPRRRRAGRGIIEQNFAASLTAIPSPPILKRIAYFDTSGKMVESYLKSPVALKPFSTIEVFIAANDVRGGTGANFVVD